VEAWGRDVVLYVGSRWEAGYPVKERLGRELWQLRPLLRPSEDWFVWQIHGFAQVDGISGRVDLNIMRAHRQ
jgi:GH25 family lysozyme M1 (1,4-beta-N-acetylmuramidase)